MTRRAAAIVLSLGLLVLLAAVVLPIALRDAERLESASGQEAAPAGIAPPPGGCGDCTACPGSAAPADDAAKTPADEPAAEADAPREPGLRPNAWFWLQRAFPHGDIRLESYREALAQAALREEAGFGLRSTWQEAGPDNIGARVTDLAVHPTDPDVVYAGMASGGVFKTVDGGTTWTPIFDDQAVLPVGAVCLDPSAPETVWVGTGEANAGSYSFFGLGVYRSDDGGASWTAKGLEETRYIGRIAVDPTDSDRVFVAATGKNFGTNPERGVYRTLDGGDSWERVHALTDSTACIDLALDPANPNRVYAAFWERVRGLNYRRSGGPSSGIWRSLDGGDTWHELTSGLPGGSDVGRIGISLCAGTPDVLYAIYADATGYFEGVYKSTNGGDTWSGTSDGALSNLYSSYGWWFGNIRVDPSNPNNVIALGLPAYRSTNGGSSWSETGSNMHVDHHATEFAPSLPSRVYNGNDGGIYRSTNSGGNWTKLYDQPSSQFYAITVDPQQPWRRYGGTQDNGTLRTTTGNIDDWTRILGGDGFYCIVDFTNSNVLYAEYQNGGLQKSTNGGGSWSGATNGISSGDRRNWSTPVVMDPLVNTRLYYGTYRLYRTTNGASSWSAISGDLTEGNSGGNYGTITTIAIAPTDTDVVYVGTDDGRVWVTPNGGSSWNPIDAGLPTRWVTRVAVDPADAATAWVSFSGLRWEDPIAYVYETTDMGVTWTAIDAGLPAAPVNVVLADPDLPGVLYAGTDVGVYYRNGPGGVWQALASGLPRAPVLDLELHNPTRELTVGTHGRSMFTLDLSSLTAVAEAAAPAARLLPAQPNPFNPATTLRFTLTEAADVTLEVFDARGRLVDTVAEGRYAAGEHALRWRAQDEHGRALPSGVYLARLAAAGKTSAQKLTLLK